MACSLSVSGYVCFVFSTTVSLCISSQARHFYDALDVAKGPGFGTNFTLSCPYTVIAHYNELDWAAGYGVDESLVRVWVGQEEEKALISVFGRALLACELAAS